ITFVIKFLIEGCQVYLDIRVIFFNSLNSFRSSHNTDKLYSNSAMPLQNCYCIRRAACGCQHASKQHYNGMWKVFRKLGIIGHGQKGDMIAVHPYMPYLCGWYEVRYALCHS